MSEVEKVRSAEKEADLDRKIQEIRRMNAEIEERHKVVTEEAKQNGVPKSFQKATVSGGNKSGSNPPNLKTSETVSFTKKEHGTEKQQPKGNQWSREWDRGKTSAEDWKMNVPELGDHGNSYFKIDSQNGSTTSSSSPRGGRGGGGGGSRGNTQPHFQQRGGPRRNGAPGKQPHNPGFFHDDRYDKSKDAEENGADGNAASADGKQADKKASSTKNNPRKPQSFQKFDNDKNQNDSSKPNMNVSNGNNGPPRQDRRGPPQGQRNVNQPRRPGGFGSKPQHNGNSHSNGFGNKEEEHSVTNKPEFQKKFENPQNNSNDKQGSPHRGRGYKSFGKPTNFSNPRPQNSPQKPKSPGNGSTTKPQNSQKLDKDGQAVKRLIDNIIDQVVRQERKEQKMNEEVVEGSKATTPLSDDQEKKFVNDNEKPAENSVEECESENKSQEINGNEKQHNEIDPVNEKPDSEANNNLKITETTAIEANDSESAVQEVEVVKNGIENQVN